MAILMGSPMPGRGVPTRTPITNIPSLDTSAFRQQLLNEYQSFRQGNGMVANGATPFASQFLQGLPAQLGGQTPQPIVAQPSGLQLALQQIAQLYAKNRMNQPNFSPFIATGIGKAMQRVPNFNPKFQQPVNSLGTLNAQNKNVSPETVQQGRQSARNGDFASPLSTGYSGVF